MLEVRRFSHFYGDRRAVEDVSLRVTGGEMVGLIGPNGAGKSTLMRGVVKAEAYPRTFFYRGKDLSEARIEERARQIAYLPQQRPVHWDLDVRNLVALGRHPLQHFPAARDVTGEVMKAMEIADLAGRRFSTLSGGEQARVHLARTLAVQAPVVLADEPVQALDPGHQFQVLDLMRRYVRNRGHAVLMILHELHLAARYCDRLILLYEGRAAAAGSPQDVLTPENLRRYYHIEAHIGDAGTGFYVLPERSVAHE